MKENNIEIKSKKISDLIEAEYNPRKLSPEQERTISDSIKRFGIVDPVLVNVHPDRENVIIGGHQRTKVAKKLGFEEMPCVELSLTLDQEKELNIRLNKNTGEFDFDALEEFFSEEDLIEWGFNQEELDFFEPEEEEEVEEDEGVNLQEMFVVPPFSVLDTRQGYWQERKRKWKDEINDNGESRDESMGKSNEEYKKDKGLKTGFKSVGQSVSILDPVMAEIVNKWFGIDKGKSFDCFSGDSVFGYVSAKMGNVFTGVELRREQAELNQERISKVCESSKYICDDGRNVADHIGEETQDLLFSCPPYYDLEVYSDLPNDASNQDTYEDFIHILRDAFTSAYSCLKNNRFAVIVVGDIRRKDGGYYRFHDDIKDIFEDCGAMLYNEMVIVEQIGTKALTANKTMETRKTNKVHQNLLVFYKGDTKQIKKEFKKIEMSNEYDW